MFERLKSFFQNKIKNLTYLKNTKSKTPYKKFMREVFPRSTKNKKLFAVSKITNLKSSKNTYFKNDKNILKLRKSVIGFQIDFNQIDLRLFFRKKGNIIATAVFAFIFILIISFSFGTRAELAKVSLYPENCLGGWQNPTLAQGKPDASNIDEFSKNNSALLSNSNAEIFCGSFAGDMPDENIIPLKFSLKLSMLVSNQELPEKIQEPVKPNIDTGPIQITPDQVLDDVTNPDINLEDPAVLQNDEVVPEPTLDTPAETPTPVDVAPTDTPASDNSTGLIQKFTKVARAQDDAPVTFDEVTPKTDEEAQALESGRIPENDFLQVSYTLDGTEWQKLGIVNGSNWKEASFNFDDPKIKSLDDLSKIQVSLKPIAGIDTQPVVYLDGMSVEVLYDRLPQQDLENNLKITIDEEKSDLNIINGSLEFSANDNPTFTITDPNLTTYEIAKLVDLGQATVVEDTNKVIENTVLIDKPIIPEILLPTQNTDPADASSTDANILPELQIDNSNILDSIKNIFSSNDTVIEPTDVVTPEPVESAEPVVPDETPTPVPDVVPDATPDPGIISSIFFQKVYAQSAPQIVSASVVDGQGDITDIKTNITTISVDGVDKSQVTIDKPEREFKPGKYTLKISLQTDNALIQVAKDFTWGVLVVNTNKSIYDLGDDAYIQMGVLDDGGHTICAAKLEMDVTTPAGIVTHFSTDDGSANLIVQDAHCGPDNFVEDGTPDYHTHFTNTTEGGEYSIKLKATTANGVKIINDKFFVDSATAFDVERITASRIQPVNNYPVTLKVKSKNAFVGTIVERVPADFIIMHPNNSVDYDNIETIGDTQIISWNLNFTAGETKTLGYYYDAPNISPEIFLLGPLQSVIDGNKIWEEARTWQIASDAVCIAAGTGNWTTITWTNCGAGPTATDSVEIPNGFSVTLNTSPTVDSIDIQNGGTLTNDGNARTLTLDGTTGTLFTLGGTGTFTPSTFITVTMNPDAAITTTSGTITFYDLNFTPTITTGRTWTMGSGAITTTGNFTINPTAASALALTVNMGANITVDATKTLSITRTTSATSLLDTRPSSTDYNISAGLLSIGTGATLDCTSAASTITLTGTTGTLFTKTGTFTITSGTPTVSVTSASGTPTLLSATTTFYNLTINSAATVINQGAFAPTVNKDFTLTAGVYNMSGASMVGTASGTLTLSASTTLCLGGTTAATSATCDSGTTETTTRVMPASFATYTLNSTSTVSYLANATTTVTAVATPGYGNLNFRPKLTTAARTYTLGNGLLVQGTLISSPTATGAAARILTVNVGTGTNTISGAVTLTGRVSAFAGSTTFAIAANTISMASVDVQLVTVASVLSFTTGTLNLTGTSGTIFTRGGTFTQGTGTVNYKGDGSLTLTSNTTYTFYNLVLNPTVATTNRTYTFGTGAITIASAGSFQINPTATNASSTAILTVTMGAAITVNANATTTIKATQVSSSTVTSVLDAKSGSNWGLSTGLLVIDAGGGYLAQASTITLTNTGSLTTLFTINTGGTFTCGTSTVLVNGVTNANYINGGTNTLTGSNKLYNLTITAAAVTKALNANLELDPAGTLTNSAAGTFQANGFSLSVGKINQSSNNAADVILGNASTITLTGITGPLWTKAASAVFTQGTSEVIVAPASGTGITLLTTAMTFHRLTINSSAAVINAGAVITMSNADAANRLYVQNGVLNDGGNTIVGTANGTLVVDSGDGLCISGTAAGTTATCNSGATPTAASTFPTNYINANITLDPASYVYYNGDAAMTISSTPTYGNLKLTPTFVITARTYTMDGALTINGNFDVIPDESGASTPALTITTAGNITVAAGKKTTLSRLNSATTLFDLRPSATDYDLSTGYLDVLTGATLDLTSDVSANAVTLTGTGALFSGILFTLTGTFTITSGTPTVVVSGNGDATLNSGTPTFYDLSFTGTGVKSLGGSITINHNMTVSAGTFDPTSTRTVTGSGTNTLTVNAGTIRSMHSTFAGDYISFETITLNTNSTVNYFLNGTQTVDNTLSYYNMTISTGGTKTLGNATTATGTTTVAGGTLDAGSGLNYALNTLNLTISGGTFVPRSSSVTISGTNGHPFTYSSGTFTRGSSAIIYTGNNSGGDTAIEDGVSYYTLEISNASETYDLEGAMTLNNNLKPTAGTLDTTGSNYAISAGRLDIGASGIFTANDSVITLTATSGTLFTKATAGTFNYGTSEVHLAGDATTITATSNQAITFYDLYVDPTITAGSAYTFGSGALTINNNFNINPTAASAFALTVNMGAAITVSGSTTITKTTSATSSLVTTASNYALTTGTLVINSGGTLNSASSSSVITLSSTTGTLFTNSSGTFTPGSSTVTVSSASGTPTFSSGLSATTLNNVTFSGAGTIALGEALNASGTLTLSGSTLTPGSQTITLSGTGTVFNNTSGTFTAGTSLIKLTNNSASLKTFAGGSGTYNNFWFAPSTGTGSLEIRGSNTFADFKDDGTIGHSILFGTGTTQTVTTFTVSGSGSGNKIIINSSDNAGGTSTSTHALVKSGGGTIVRDYLDIQHSVATPSSTWYAGNNSTNNQATATAGSGWIFGSGFTVSGIVYKADKSTLATTGNSGDCDGSTANVSLRVNGGTAVTTTCSNTTAAFSFSGVSAVSGDTIAIYLTGTNKANTVYISDGTADTGKDLYYDTVALSHETAGPILNSDLTDYDSTINATDMLYDINTSPGVALTTNASTEVYIPSSFTYSPDVGLYTGRLNIAGTFNATASTYQLSTVSGIPLTLTGSLVNGSTASFIINGDASLTITSGTFTGSNALGGLQLTPVLTAARVYTFGSGAIEMNSDFQINPQTGAYLLTVNMANSITVTPGSETFIGGTTSTSVLDLRPSATDYNLTTGKINIASTGTLDAGSSSSVITLTGTSGTLFTKHSSGTFTQGSSSVVASGNGDALLNSIALTFYDLTSSGTGVKSLNDNITIDHDMTVSAGTFDPTASYTVTGSGTNALSVSNGATIRVEHSTFVGTWISFETVTLSSGSTVDYFLSGTQTVDDTLSYSNLKVSTGGTKTLAGNTTVSNVMTINASATLALSTYTLTLSGGVGTPFVVTGTLSGGTGTVEYTGNNGGGNINVAPTTYCNLTINNSSETFVLTGTTVVGKDCTTTITGGSTLDTSGSNYTFSTGYISVAGAFNANGSSVSLTGDDGTLFANSGTFNAGTSTVNLEHYSRSWDNTNASTSDDYTSITQSTDGTKIWATSSTLSGSGYIWFSLDSGLTFNFIDAVATTPPGQNVWKDISCDSTCTNIVAIEGKNVWYTNDSGDNWSSQNLGVTDFSAIDSDTTGQYHIMVESNGDIWYDVGYGTSWTDAGYSDHWTDVSCDNFCANAYAVSDSSAGGVGDIMLTTNGGVSWSSVAPSTGMNWKSVATDSTSSYVTAVASGDYIYSSSNAGASWATITSTGAQSWTAVAMDSSGSDIMAVINGGGSYHSDDSGAHFTQYGINNGNLNFTNVVADDTNVGNYYASMSGDLLYSTNTRNNAVIASGSPTFYNLDANLYGENYMGESLTVTNNLTTSLGSIDTAMNAYSLNAGRLLITSPLYVNSSDVNITGTSGTLITGTLDAPSSLVTLSGNGSATLSTTAQDFYDLTSSGTGTKTLGAAITVSRDMTISAGTFDVSASNYGVTVGRNWTNSATFTPRSGLVTWNSGQTATVTGPTSFYDLTITHTSAKEVDFSNTAGHIIDVTHTFNATGNSGQLIKLWSVSPTNKWHFHPTGSATTDYANVKDGGCESGSISITSTNFTNSGNNDSCWAGASITFSIDDASIGFGALTTANARFATGDTLGSNTDTTYATRMNVNTTGTTGLTLTYIGDLLKFGANDIDAANITNDADGAPGTTEAFGLGVAVSGASTVASGYDHNATAGNRDWKYVANTTTTIVSDTTNVTNENIDVYYLTNINSTTAAGDYTTSITYIITGTF